MAKKDNQDVRLNFINILFHRTDFDIEPLSDDDLNRAQSFVLFKNKVPASFDELRAIFIAKLLSFPNSEETKKWLEKNGELLSFVVDMGTRNVLIEADKTIKESEELLDRIEKEKELERRQKMIDEIEDFLEQRNNGDEGNEKDVQDDRRMILISFVAYLIREKYIKNKKKIGVLHRAFLKKTGLLDDKSDAKVEDLYDLFEEVLNKVFAIEDSEVTDKVLEDFFGDMRQSLDDMN